MNTYGETWSHFEFELKATLEIKAALEIYSFISLPRPLPPCHDRPSFFHRNQLMRTQIKHRGFPAELWAPPFIYTFSQAFSLINIWCWLVECATSWVWFQHLDKRNLLHSVAAANSHHLWTCILKVLTGAIGLSLCCYALACEPNMKATVQTSWLKLALWS